MAAAARENGKKGGRPRKRRDFGDFDGVESPPRHPLKLGYWMQRVLALDALRVDQGRGDKEVSKALRAYARAPPGRHRQRAANPPQAPAPPS